MIHIKIDESLKEQLRQEARERGLSLNAYIRLIIFERGK